MSMAVVKRKRVILKPGDVFEFAASDGRFGYGVIVLGGRVPYVIMLQGLYKSRPSLETLANDKVVLVGSTMDSLIYHGKWTIVFHKFDIPRDLPFPNWKVEVEGRVRTTDFEGRNYWAMRTDEKELLDFKFSMSPKTFQDAAEALNGLQAWRPDCEKLLPEYARLRVTRR